MKVLYWILLAHTPVTQPYDHVTDEVLGIYDTAAGCIAAADVFMATKKGHQSSNSCIPGELKKAPPHDPHMLDAK